MNNILIKFHDTTLVLLLQVLKMSKLFTSLLYLVNIIIATSQETAINNNNESKTQDYGKEQKRPHIIIIIADDMVSNFY